MDTMTRLAVLARTAQKLARSAAELAEAAEVLQQEICGQAAGQGPAQAIAAPEPKAPAKAPADPQERADPVLLDTMRECKIERAWEYDIFAIIERLKLAGIPARQKRSGVNGTSYIDVDNGDLIQSLADGGNSMAFRWYGAGQ